MHRDVVHLAVCSFNTGFLVTGSEDGHAWTPKNDFKGGDTLTLVINTSFVDSNRSRGEVLEETVRRHRVCEALPGASQWLGDLFPSRFTLFFAGLLMILMAFGLVYRDLGRFRGLSHA